MELRKVLLFVGIPALILFGPFFILSTAAMGCYQAQIDKNPNSESSKAWQLRLADINLNTMRPELAATMYEKFADRYPDDPRRPETLWLLAYACERADMKKEAIDALVRLCREHPDHARGKDADDRLMKRYNYQVR
ncbi:MAG: tetratricopeptide repeat protein [Planctomycetes bacterium]|nr:tetratricopeptide repeat protein [Planctomycetota bacterium]